MKKLILAVCSLLASVAWGGIWSDTQVERAVTQQLAKQSSTPRVACEIQQNGAYQLAPEAACLQDPSAKEEVLLLKRFLTELAQFAQNTTYHTKWLGPVNLSEQVFQQTFLVNHSWRAITERFMGFGPEDDPQFDYTQPGYYPEGSVKVNLTERAFDVIRLYYGDIVPRYGEDSSVAKGLRGFVGMVFFHEMLHGWQLHTLPVLDYKRLDIADLNAMLASRRPDYKIVWGSNQIVNYEEDANVFSYHYMASVYNDFNAFVKEFEKLSQERDFFTKYPRLADSFYQYYLVNESAAAKELLEEISNGKTLDTFNELNTYTYRGQNTPLQTWVDMVQINDRLENGVDCTSVADAVRAKYNYFMNLAVPEWNGRTEDNAHDAIIMDTIRSIEKGYSGLKETKEAALKEFKTYEKRCNVKL